MSAFRVTPPRASGWLLPLDPLLESGATRPIWAAQTIRGALSVAGFRNQRALTIHLVSWDFARILLFLTFHSPNHHHFLVFHHH